MGKYTNVEAVGLIINANFKGPQTLNERHGLPLHAACRNGANLQIIRELISANPEAVSTETLPLKNLPLHLALANDDIVRADVIKSLIVNYRESVQHANAEGNYPLHIACLSCASEEVLNLLLAKNGMDALHHYNNQGNL